MANASFRITGSWMYMNDEDGEEFIRVSLTKGSTHGYTVETETAEAMNEFLKEHKFIFQCYETDDEVKCIKKEF